MRGFRLASVAAFAFVAIVASSHGVAAQTPQAQPQYYGYTNQQAPMASPQGGMPCQACQACHGCQMPPPPDCQPEKCGCNVVDHRVACQNPAPIPMPGFETCQNSCQNAILIESECAPDQPATWVTVYRNHYVPIKVVNRPANHQVRPVNIVIKTREVHYLCDCAPGVECPHGPPPTPQKNPMPMPQTGAVPTNPAPDAQMTSATPAAPAPVAPVQAAPTPAQPAKTWVYLTAEKLYGYGYQRADGYWIIDPGNRRTTLPTAPPAASTAGTTDALKPTGS